MNIEQNKKMWSDCPWKYHGEEWSQAWGCTAKLWQQTVFPRIHPLFTCAPKGDWLEIGCGHGRMTYHLLDETDEYKHGVGIHPTVIGVDLVPECVDYCRKRFADDERLGHVRFELADGKNPLERVDDESIGFAFSWDSLVHCDLDTIKVYAVELKRVLAKGGYAFLHHSNLGQGYGMDSTKTPHLRDPSCTVNLVTRVFRKNGLAVILQELVNWGGGISTIDCFTVVKKCDLRRAILQPIRNPNFMEEAHAARRLMEIEQQYVDVVGSQVD